jgi:DNA-binding transcriptional LysR family regulator
VEVIRRCLLAKMGIGLLPRCVVNADIEQGHLAEQAVDGAPYLFRSSLIWPEEATPSARLLAFIEAVNANAIQPAQTGKVKQTRIHVKRKVAVQE